MEVGRRAVVKLLGAAALTLFGPGGPLRRLAFAQSAPKLVLRPVAAGDAEALRAIMTSCVGDVEAFFGKCGEWPLSWAEKLIAKKSQTLVITRDGVPVAFHELPPIGAPEAPLSANATAAEREAHALRERNRRTFRVTAAGVRDDLVTPEESVRLFRRIIYYTFKAARAMGYEHAECFAPWERHPRMARKWTDYSGCELVEPVVRNQEGGPDIYYLRWRLEDAILALEAEGAHAEHLDAA